MFEKIFKNSTQVGKAIIISSLAALSVCCITSILYAMQAKEIAKIVSIIGVTTMIGGASFLTGSILGFIFGIPRTLQEGDQINKKENRGADSSDEKQSQKISYQNNTNLEQISDWVTKILVGVGLTQIAQIPNLLDGFARYSHKSLGEFSNSGIYSQSLLIFSSIFGFLLTYICTTIYLKKAYVEADSEILEKELAKVKHDIDEIQKQAGLDAKALELVHNQLDILNNYQQIPQGDLNKAISNASKNVKAQIFYQARGVREDNWNAHKNKEINERSIPIYKALIHDDKENIYHRNHAQLGYALKDKEYPDWKEAAEEITKAIHIRDSLHKDGYAHYEYMRAICKICLEEDFQKRKESDPEEIINIASDINTAMKENGLKEMILKDEIIRKWLDLNNLKPDENEIDVKNIQKIVKNSSFFHKMFHHDHLEDIKD